MLERRGDAVLPTVSWGRSSASSGVGPAGARPSAVPAASQPPALALLQSAGVDAESGQALLSRAACWRVRDTGSSLFYPRLTPSPLALQVTPDGRQLLDRRKRRLVRRRDAGD